MSVALPDDRSLPVITATDEQGRLTMTIGGRTIALGRLISSIHETGRALVRPEKGDRATFTISRSLMSWPTLLEFNFMTGHSPSWKRHLYYRLLWQRANGARLEMLWRYQQFHYSTDGWASGFMTKAGDTGLLWARVSP